MVRTNRWKLNYLNWDRCELFDIVADPGEFHNRIDDTCNAGVVHELKGIAERMYAC